MTRNRISFFTFCLLVAFNVAAQDNQPFTRYGVGALHPQLPASLRGWGYQGTADQDPHRFNLSNPASLGSLQNSVLQAGLYGRGTWLRRGDSTDAFGNASVDYVMLGVPVVRNKWGLSIALQPYARTSYSVVQLNDESGGVPKSINRSRGRGALYEASIGSGWQFNRLSFGIRGAYLFGNIAQTSLLVFDDTLNGFNTRFRQERSFNGFTWNAGVQYFIPLQTRDRLQAGLSFRVANHVNARRDLNYERFLFGQGNIEVPFDTIHAAYDEKGTITLPAEYRAGIVYKRYANDKRDALRWQTGIDAAYTDFEVFRSFGEPDSLRNALRVAAGFEWVPREEALEGYHNRIRYRFGAYYSSGGLFLRNNAFSGYGITLGLGLPLRRVFSFVDASFDYGTYGPADKTLLRQNYLNGTLGFSFSDRWFMKRRYD